MQAYILATTEQRVRWYRFVYGDALKPGEFTLEPQLDLGITPQFGDKATARSAAQALGLKTWRYVRL